MRTLLWLCALSILLTGCGEEDLRARFQAEKGRYWAERQALRFSLQADPQMRRRYYESGLAFLAVAQTAKPELQSPTLSDAVRSDLGDAIDNVRAVPVVDIPSLLVRHAGSHRNQ